MPALSLIAAAMLGSALPPSSAPGIAGRIPHEPRSVPVYRPTTGAQAQILRRDIRVGRNEGELTRREARRLEREVREIGRLEDRYAAGGISDAERAELRSRVEVLRALTRGKRLGAVR